MILGKEEYEGQIKIGSNTKIGYIPQEIKFENEEETVFETFIKSYIGTETEARRFLSRFMFYRDDVFKKISK